MQGGEDESDSNFIQLLNLRAEDDVRIKDWMEKKTDKYVSHDMQNEILKVMSLQVSHKIIDCLHSTDYFTIMIDETTDCSNSEQVVICCRWVDSSLEAHEEFMGLYQLGSTKASALVHVIKDFLLRSNLSISKLRG